MYRNKRWFHFYALLTTIATALLASLGSSGAEISILDNRIELHGEITKDDPARFRAVLARLEQTEGSLQLKRVHLDSGGGDVFAAMEIGRQIRAKLMATDVSMRCISACVFIYAGAVVSG